MIRPSLSQFDLSSRDGLLEWLRALSEPEFARQERIAEQQGFFFPPAWYSRTGAEMEAWSRILWGMVPALLGCRAGGQPPPDWLTHAAERYARRLCEGCDPDHSGYWGRTVDRDQRFVEMAVLGVCLNLLPEVFTKKMEAAGRGKVAAWLSQILDRELPPNNWHFFRVFACLGLDRLTEGLPGGDLGEQTRRRERMEADLAHLDSCYLGDGWYEDGPGAFRDYYNPFAFHFYGLLFSGMRPDHPLAAAFRQRTALFLEDYVRLFDRDGRAVPFGRSLTYRFAQGSLLSACAAAGLYRENDDQAPRWFTLSYLKTVLVRHLHYWTGLPIFSEDGRLAVGYGYPNTQMAEEYNAHGSPGWALKTAWILALPKDHPYWTAPVLKNPDWPAESLKPMPQAGFLSARSEGGTHAWLLNAGQWRSRNPRHGEDKYAKLVYSSRFAFAVSVGPIGLNHTAVDCTLAVSTDGDYWRTRTRTEIQRVTDRWVCSRWRPWSDKEASLKTWLVPDGPGHWRIHLIEADTPFTILEGGFACPYDGEPSLPDDEDWRRGSGLECLLKRNLCSAGRLLAIEGSVSQPETGVNHLAAGSHLLFPRCRVPWARAAIAPGIGLLISAWYGGAEREAGLAWLRSRQPYPKVNDKKGWVATLPLETGERVEIQCG